MDAVSLSSQKYKIYFYYQKNEKDLIDKVLDLFKTNNIKNVDFSLRGVCDPEKISRNNKKKLKRIVTLKYYTLATLFHL